MAHTIGLRATSLAASATLLGLAVLAGLTMTIVQRRLADPTGPGVITLLPPPREEQPPPPPAPARPPAPPTEGLAVLPLDPLPPSPAQQLAGVDTTSIVEPPLITNPEWVRRPRDLARYYPARALERGVDGRVVLDCAVSVAGTLNCAVVSETPQNWGFAAAALRISRDYQMVPATRNGLAVEGRHRMVIPFEVR